MEREEYLAALGDEIIHLRLAILSLQQFSRDLRRGQGIARSGPYNNAATAGNIVCMPPRIHTGAIYEDACDGNWKLISFGLSSRN